MGTRAFFRSACESVGRASLDLGFAGESLQFGGDLVQGFVEFAAIPGARVIVRSSSVALGLEERLSALI